MFNLVWHWLFVHYDCASNENAIFNFAERAFVGEFTPRVQKKEGGRGG